MEKIIVPLKGNKYSICIGNSIFNSVNDEIANLGLHKNILIIVDGNVAKQHLNNIKRVFYNNGRKVELFFLKPGENSKSYVELNKIYKYLLQKGFGRDTLIVGIGGGVTGDLAGYAAATYMRGVQLLHIPTTLLAAVDSAIGGKTGINFEKKKNMIGAFYQPRIVFIDTSFFNTLPVKEITSGLGEIIKCGYLSDRNFFDYLRNNISNIYDSDENAIQHVILKSAGIKASVVSQDEKESGIRKILNLGHTFAHGIETELNFRIKHGEAVIAGIVAALFLSNGLGFIDRQKLNDLLSLPLMIKLPKALMNIDIQNVLKIMQHDKKNRNGIIKFVLPLDIGNIALDIEADKKKIVDAIKKMRKNLNF